MKKSARSCSIMQTLMDNPNRDFSLGYFADEFECAKSSISEDIKIVREAVEYCGTGYIETTAGSKGGVRYIPSISRESAMPVLEELKAKLEEPDRMLGSGFIYTSDIMFDPRFSKTSGRIFAKCFANEKADVVVTVETKGIPTATFVADTLGLPLAVIRHESKVSDGSTVSINYFSGSSERIQQMSLSKRALKPGSRAIIIDDFMRGGGSIKGICDMLAEFDCTVTATGVVLSVAGPSPKRVGDYCPLLLVDADALKTGICRISINEDIL